MTDLQRTANARSSADTPSSLAFYNEIDPFAARWLRSLIAAGHLPPGDVDERSIVDVRPSELAQYSECHWFSGIGGWPYALSLAGWRGPVWTGSCPCQPLSSAGNHREHADQRHLWPAFYGLVAECRPATIFGEQIANAAGREWLAGVRADLEHLGYAVGAADLPAASAGAPHQRQRLFWAATEGMGYAPGEQRRGMGEFAPGSKPAWSAGRSSGWDNTVPILCRDGQERVTQRGLCPLADGVPARLGRLRGYGNAIVPQVAAEFVRAFIEIIAMSEERTPVLNPGETEG